MNTNPTNRENDDDTLGNDGIKLFLEQTSDSPDITNEQVRAFVQGDEEAKHTLWTHYAKMMQGRLARTAREKTPLDLTAYMDDLTNHFIVRVETWLTAFAQKYRGQSQRHTTRCLSGWVWFRVRKRFMEELFKAFPELNPENNFVTVNFDSLGDDEPLCESEFEEWFDDLCNQLSEKEELALRVFQGEHPDALAKEFDCSRRTVERAAARYLGDPKWLRRVYETSSLAD